MDQPLSSRIDLKNLSRQELTDFVVDQGLSPYRGRQIFSWLYRPGITEIDQMTDIAKKVRRSLAGQVFLSRLEIARKEISKDGTVKYALRLADGHTIESVLIPEERRLTLCVSSQVGCAMGCTFCLTATMGFIRNLTPAEITGQITAVQDDMTSSGKEKINNLVFMGMGEPLANLDNLVKALEILMDDLGLNFSDRRTTVSTCGLPCKIRELGRRIRINLAVSLHAADNETRSFLMPINKRYPVEEVLAACHDHPLPRRKRIMFEYALIKGVNDSVEDARKLAKILRGIPCKINLIPCNEIPEQPFSSVPGHFQASPPERVVKFQQILRDANLGVFLRASRGADISAACGQLAARNRLKS
ncbi:MAG: 23S rRNA (adenine(2503)-C(2))-methyltransferase RlmN [Desulfobia sp.]